MYQQNKWNLYRDPNQHSRRGGGGGYGNHFPKKGLPSTRGPTSSPPVLPTSNSTSNTSSHPVTGPAGTGSGTGGSPGSSSSTTEQLSKTNLYIRGLTQNTTDKDLFNLCTPYGPIISTKAILDKNTNKCKGYGFVDFESPQAAETAVKALQAQGVQAQMAKQQEQDPTNLYIANLPPMMAEGELEEMLLPYGSVISTRILRDSSMQSRGVGFARMDSREMCELIIQKFNGRCLAGCKEGLLVKFADGGSKRRNQYKNQEHRLWQERGEGLQVAYDQSVIPQNGVASQLVSPLSGYQRPYSTSVPYQLQPGTTWVHPPQYIVQPPLAQMIPSQLDPSTLHYGALMPQLTTHMSQLQLSGTSYVAGTPHPYTGTPTAATPALYHQPAHLVQPVPLTEDPMSASVPVSGTNSGNEDQTIYQQTYNQAK